MTNTNMMKKQNIMKWLVQNPVQPDQAAEIKQKYSITDSELFKVRESLVDHPSRLEDKYAGKRITIRDREQMNMRIEGRVKKINDKLKRELYRNFDDPNAVKIILETAYKTMPGVYEAMGKGLKVDMKSIELIASNTQGANSRIINKNLRMSREALYEQMKVTLTSDNMTKHVSEMLGKEMFSFMDRGSTVIVKNDYGAPVSRRDQMKYKTKIESIRAKDADWDRALKESKVQGERPLIPINRKYGLDDSTSFEQMSARRESLDKQDDLDYKEWRVNVTRNNYIEAARNTFGESSSSYQQIKELANQLSPVDFERFGKTYVSGGITYMYDFGKNNENEIITDLKTAIKQSGGNVNE